MVDHLNPQYLLLFWESQDGLIEKTQLKTKQAISQHQSVLFVNLKNTDEVRFFLNQNYFDIRNAGFAWLIYGFQMFFIVLILIILMGAFVGLNTADQPKKTKALKKNVTS